MAEHPIQGLMNVTMEKIHQMVDSNTIIGKPITTEDGITILPVSKVSFGFASGGTDFDGKNAANKDLFGGGSGAGVNIQPVAFLVIKDGCVRTIQLSDTSNTIDRALTMLPELVDKLAAMVKKDDKTPEAAPAGEVKCTANYHRRNCELPTHSFDTGAPAPQSRGEVRILSAGRRTRSLNYGRRTYSEDHGRAGALLPPCRRTDHRRGPRQGQRPSRQGGRQDGPQP